MIGSDGQPQLRTSLARKAPAKPAPDWRPAVDGIVAQTEKMRQTDTKLQGAAFGLFVPLPAWPRRPSWSRARRMRQPGG